MKKSTSVLVGLIVVVVIVVGAYAIFHKSPKAKVASATTSQSKTPAVSNAVLITKTDSKVGQYLSDPSGKALYTYSADTSGVSNCTGSCLADWPAYQDTGSTAGLPQGISTIKRTDNGQTQYTYNGKPLYYFASDSTGEVTGNGEDNFSVAVPAAASSSSQSTTTAPSSTSTQSTSNTSSSNPYNY